MVESWKSNTEPKVWEVQKTWIQDLIQIKQSILAKWPDDEDMIFQIEVLTKIKDQ